MRRADMVTAVLPDRYSITATMGVHISRLLPVTSELPIAMSDPCEAVRVGAG